MFGDLAARNMKLEGWLRRFGEAKKLYLHHIREEEQEQFVESEKILTVCGSSLHAPCLQSAQARGKGAARVTPKIKLK